MSDFITLQCPSCGGKTQLAPDNRNYVCQYCGNEHAMKLSSPAAAEPARKRSLIPRPEGVTLRKTDKGEIELIWRWFSPKYLVMLVFCFMWDGFLCFWYAMASGGGAPLMMFVFPIFHVAVGVGLTYSTLAGLLNRTTLRLGKGMLTVQHDPIPWPGETKIKLKELDQLYCTKEVQQGKRGTTETFDLVAFKTDGKEKKLLSRIDQPEIAAFLEQQIERLLKIEDVPVIGEAFE